MSDPKPRTSFDRAVTRRDSYENVFTNVGVYGKDKSLGSTPTFFPLAYAECETLYRGNDLASRAVDLWVDEAHRQGWKLKIRDKQAKPGDRSMQEQAEDATTYFEELDAEALLVECEQKARWGGGSAILVGADDGALDLRQPLREDAIRSIKFLTVLTSRELVPARMYRDPLQKNFGKVEIWRVQPEADALLVGGQIAGDMLEVHESRLIIFPGIEVSKAQLRANNMWGDSIFNRMNKVLSDYSLSWSAAVILLQDFAQAVIKIKDLAMLIDSDRDDVVVERFKMIDLGRSVARAIVLNEGEEYERKATPIQGMPEMLDRLAKRLCAACRMPASLLFGDSPAGLNATGAVNERWFYDEIKTYQNRTLKPRHTRLMKLCLLAKDNEATNGVEPDDWCVEYQSPWQMTDKEKAEIRKLSADTDKVLIDAQVITPEEACKSHFGGDGFNPDLEIDWGLRDKFGAIEAEEIPGIDPVTELPLAPIPGQHSNVPGKSPPVKPEKSNGKPEVE